MTKYAIIITDNRTGKERVHDYYRSLTLANDALYHLESKQRSLISKFRIVADSAPKKCACETKKNPVPPSSRAGRKRATSGEVDRAKLLYENFTGHDADHEEFTDKPHMPDVLSVIGDIDGILYTTVRDGVKEKYIHPFKAKSRPLFCVSPDGGQIFLIGGSYEFTERGIVDKS